MIKFKTGITLTFIIGLAITAATLSPIADVLNVTTGDKVYHAMAFALFVIPMIWVSPKFWRYMIAASVILGAGIEVMQPYVNQVGDVMDLVADVMGAILGVITGYFTSTLYRAYKPRPIELHTDSFQRQSARIFQFRDDRFR